MLAYIAVGICFAIILVDVVRGMLKGPKYFG